MPDSYLTEATVCLIVTFRLWPGIDGWLAHNDACVRLFHGRCDGAKVLFCLFFVPVSPVEMTQALLGELPTKLQEQTFSLMLWLWLHFPGWYVFGGSSATALRASVLQLVRARCGWAPTGLQVGFRGLVELLDGNVAKLTCLWQMVRFRIASLGSKKGDVGWDSGKHRRKYLTLSAILAKLA